MSMGKFSSAATRGEDRQTQRAKFYFALIFFLLLLMDVSMYIIMMDMTDSQPELNR